MWSGPGGWGHFPMQQSAYANIPSEEVDWASLAKQWIAQREVMSSSTVVRETTSLQYMPNTVPPPPPPLPPVCDVVQPSTGKHHETLPTQSESNAGDSCNSQDSMDAGSVNQISCESAGHQPGWDSWSGTGWSMPSWALPPPPPPDQTDNVGVSKDQFNQPESFMTSYDYSQNIHGFFDHRFNSGSITDDIPYWSVHNDQHPPHLMPQQTGCEYRPAPRRDFLGHTGNVPSLLDDSLLDATKRRQLPAWIREGLEKMEHEKHKLSEREKVLLDSKNFDKADDEIGLGNQEDGKIHSVKSRFDSDNEDISTGEIICVKQHVSMPVKYTDHSPDTKVHETLTEEERQLQIMVRVRQMLTEVLLDVTNQEIADIACNVYKSAKAKQAKAPAKQLAKSSALASITTLGLGYDSNSSDEDIIQGDSASICSFSDSSDDAAVQERIAQKKTLFEQRMRHLEESEQEEASNQANLLQKQKLGSSLIKQNKKCIMYATNENACAITEYLVDDKRDQFQVLPDTPNVSVGVSYGNSDKLRHMHDLKKSGITKIEHDDDKSYCKDLACHRLEIVSKDSMDSSVAIDSEYYGKDDKLHAQNIIVEKRAVKSARLSCNKETICEKTSQELDKCDSAMVEKKYEEHKGRNEKGNYRRSDWNDDIFVEQSNNKCSDSSGKRHSSHSHDNDSKKYRRKRHESHKHKRKHDVEFDDHLDRSRDTDSSSRHKKHQRSCSSSESLDSLSRSRHRRRSYDKHDLKRHHRQSSSRSREKSEKGSYGKKSHAKRKSRSPSSSSGET